MIRKIFISFLFVSSFIFFAGAQTIITYGPYKVSKDELWKAYTRNNTDKGANALKDYVSLYTNFKLKVKAAEDMRLDTLLHIKQDMANFRTQIMENYLADENGVKKLQQEAFDRSQKDLHVMHYILPFTSADSVKAATDINVIYNQLTKGVREEAISNTSFKGEDLGYLTVFSVPYFYENIIYGLQQGEYSKPALRNNAWHIFKVMDVRPAAGTWKVAQILFAFPPNATDAEKEAAKKKADSVYMLIQNGLDFGDAAKDYSNDRVSNLTQGMLPEFGTGRYKPEFENFVFALKKDGDISRPFSTSFGYHIAKRISVKPVPSNVTDAEYQYELKQKISADTRMAMQKEKYEDQILKQTGFKLAAGNSIAKLSSLIAPATIAAPSPLKSTNKSIIGQFADGTKLTAAEWINYVTEYKKSDENAYSLSNAQLWDKYLHYASTQHFKENLEHYNEEFKNQVKEFNDGNLLFEVMDKKVWSRASANEDELKKYYSDHKGKYLWGKNADAIIFNCSNKKMAETIMTASKAGDTWREIVEKNQGNVFADSGRYELDQLIAQEHAPNPQAGSYSDIVVNTDNAASFVYYKYIYPSGGQRSFADARGLVINDYQDVLETKWLNVLRQKYPVKVNDELVRSLSK